MIIFGLRVLRKLLGTGVFHCPRCGRDCAFKHLRARRWFHIFFIPLIPLDDVGTYVECQACRGTFVDAVLSAPTNAQLEEALAVAARAAVAHLVSLAPGPEVEARAIARLAGAARVAPGYDAAALAADVAAYAAPDAVMARVRALGPVLTAVGQEAFLRRVVVVAAALPERATASATQAVDAYAEAIGASPTLVTGLRVAAARDEAGLPGER